MRKKFLRGPGSSKAYLSIKMGLITWMISQVDQLLTRRCFQASDRNSNW